MKIEAQLVADVPTKTASDLPSMTMAVFAVPPLIAPLTANAIGVWGRRFDVPQWPEQKVSGMEGAMAMPAFQIQPGQTYSAKFEIYAGPKIYHRLAQLPRNEAEIMDFGMFKIVCQFLLNFMNLLHSWLRDYGLAILALTTVIKLTLWPIQNKAVMTRYSESNGLDPVPASFPAKASARGAIVARIASHAATTQIFDSFFSRTVEAPPRAPRSSV